MRNIRTIWRESRTGEPTFFACRLALGDLGLPVVEDLYKEAESVDGTGVENGHVVSAAHEFEGPERGDVEELVL